MKRLHFVCLVSSPIPSLLLMAQRDPPQAVWYHRVQSWSTMVYEVLRRGVLESKNIDYARQHHTPHCWLPVKVMYPANSTKRFSWLTRSTSILLMKNVQIYIYYIYGLYILHIILYTYYKYIIYIIFIYICILCHTYYIYCIYNLGCHIHIDIYYDIYNNCNIDSL